MRLRAHNFALEKVAETKRRHVNDLPSYGRGQCVHVVCHVYDVPLAQ